MQTSHTTQLLHGSEFTITMTNYFMKFADAINLSKRYPTYFSNHTKMLVRVGFFIVLLYLIYLGLTFGWGTNVVVSCPATEQQCFNEYYDPYCDEAYCTKQYLVGGETLGNPLPVKQITFFWVLFLGMIVFVAIVNHLIYVYRSSQ